MHSTLIVLTGPPLPARWTLVQALGQRLGAVRFAAEAHPEQVEQALAKGACVLLHGELRTVAERTRWLALGADERLLVELQCARADADREIFHRYAARPWLLAERELQHYLDDATHRQPVEGEAARLVTLSTGMPLQDQVLCVVEALRPRAAPAPAPPHRLSVLVVEDDADQRALLGEVLRELGCAVELAPDGGVALALLDGGRGAFDLVLSDQRMPGLSGVELARAIGERHPRVRTILLTAYGDRQTCRSAAETTVGVLSKPVRVVDLQRALDEAQRR